MPCRRSAATKVVVSLLKFPTRLRKAGDFCGPVLPSPSWFTRRLRAMGIRDKPISAGSPWQNGSAERLIGTLRRECVDHLIVLAEAHLRRALFEFAAYYNGSRVHHSLAKDAPFHRAIERVGSITSRPILGGLHHQYCRV